MIDRLTAGWKALTAAGTAIVAVAGGSWGLFEYEADKAAQRHQNAEEIEVVGKAIKGLKERADMDRWLYLQGLREKVGLGPNQHKEYCYLGKLLFGDFKCPVYDGRKPRSD